MLTRDTDDSESSESGKKEVRKTPPPPPPPQEQSVQAAADANPPPLLASEMENDGSLGVQASAVFVCAPDGASLGRLPWETLWPYMSVPENFLHRLGKDTSWSARNFRSRCA